MALNRTTSTPELRAQRLAQFTPEQIEMHRLVMKQIEAEPERWNQSNWITGAAMIQARYLAKFQNGIHKFYESIWDVNTCSTTMCYAGWTAHLAGYQFRGDGTVVGEDGEVRSARTVATELLGLDWNEADIIFDAYAAKTPEQMKETVTMVTGIEFD